MTVPEATLALFYLFNTLRAVIYLPQIIRVAQDQEGAQAISCCTWALWVGANAATAAYAVVNITDWLLFGMSVVNMLGCAGVLSITLWKRRRRFVRRAA